MKLVSGNLISKTKVKITMNPLGPVTQVSATAKFRGTNTLLPVLKKNDEKKMKCLDGISELLSNTRCTDI